ncbi:MAG: pyridoxal 5'-phosphate synthase glutaminase subunit PdxT [Candidatus Neomarinimicrobiota bacterium]
MVTTIGVLSLQGDFALHMEILVNLGQMAKSVRYPNELEDLRGLIIPGGESTTISKQLDRSGLREAVIEFARERPVLGTCAGLILMARDPSDTRVIGLNLIDMVVSRNSWGRQVHSFTTSLQVQVNGRMDMIPAIFIRAPRIEEVGPNVEILARIDDEPVLVRQGCHLGATFHPELTRNTRIHELFLQSVAV